MTCFPYFASNMNFHLAPFCHAVCQPRTSHLCSCTLCESPSQHCRVKCLCVAYSDALSKAQSFTSIYYLPSKPRAQKKKTFGEFQFLSSIQVYGNANVILLQYSAAILGKNWMKLMVRAIQTKRFVKFPSNYMATSEKGPRISLWIAMRQPNDTESDTARVDKKSHTHTQRRQTVISSNDNKFAENCVCTMLKINFDNNRRSVRTRAAREVNSARIKYFQ